MNEEEMLRKLLKQAQQDIKIWQDLYNKEKEKNKELEATLKQTQNSWFEDTKKIEQ